MLEHGKRQNRLSTELSEEVAPPPDMSRKIQDCIAQLQFLGMLEMETRRRVSASAANDLQKYVKLLQAKLNIVAAFDK